MSRSDRTALRILLAFAAAFLVVQGVRGIWERDEGRYTDVAVEMLRTGDYVHPRLNLEQPHFSKPPVTYWALAAAMRTLGRNEWAARLPNTLAFLGTLFLIGRLAGWLAPGRRLAATLIYGTSLLPLLGANYITTDTLLTFWETLGVYGLVRGILGADRRGLFRLLGWAAFGLAFLTKGPPGLLPLAAILLASALSPGLRFRSVPTFPGILVFLAVASSWFVAVILGDRALFTYFYREEVLGRILSGRHHRNSEWYAALYVYGPVFLAGSLPWTGICFPRARLKRVLSGRFWKALATGDPRRFLLATWLVLPTLVFLLSKSRLPLYVLPQFVPLAMIAARGLPEGFRPGPVRRRVLVLWGVLILGTFTAAGFLHLPMDDRAFSRSVTAAHPGPIDQIVFVGARPRYGLNFYLDTEVEFAREHELRPGRDAEDGDLAEELREERPGTRLWFVRSRWEAPLRAWFGRRGFEAERLGGHGKFAFYRFRRTGIETLAPKDPTVQD